MREIYGPFENVSNVLIMRIRIQIEQYFYGFYLNKRFWLRLTHGTIPPYPTSFYLKQQRFSGWILLFLLLNFVFIGLNLTFNQFHGCFYVLLRNNIYIFFFSLCVYFPLFNWKIFQSYQNGIYTCFCFIQLSMLLCDMEFA